MPKQITIRRVPDEIHSAIQTRAERMGQSMQQFLLDQLELLVPRDKLRFDEWFKRVRSRRREGGPSIEVDDILKERDIDRK